MAHWCFCDPEISQFLTMDDNTYQNNTEMPVNKKMSPKIACLLLLVGEIDECRLFEVLDCKYWKYTLFF